MHKTGRQAVLTANGFFLVAYILTSQRQWNAAEVNEEWVIVTSIKNTNFGLFVVFERFGKGHANY